MIAPGLKDTVHSATKILAITTALQRVGIPIHKALSGTELSGEQLNMIDTRVSRHQTMIVMDNAAQLTQDKNFAFETGYGFNLSSYGIYGFSILSSQNLLQAGSYALHYRNLANPLIDLAQRETHDHLIWHFKPT